MSTSISLDDDTILDEDPTGPTWPPDGRTGEWWMFWQEDQPHTPPVQLLREAITYFYKKYTVTPNNALVPLGWEDLLKDAKGQPTQALPDFPGLRVLTTRTMGRGQVWLTYFPHEQEHQKNNE